MDILFKILYSYYKEEYMKIFSFSWGILPENRAFEKLIKPIGYSRGWKSISVYSAAQFKTINNQVNIDRLDNVGEWFVRHVDASGLSGSLRSPSGGIFSYANISVDIVRHTLNTTPPPFCSYRMRPRVNARGQVIIIPLNNPTKLDLTAIAHVRGRGQLN